MNMSEQEKTGIKTDKKLTKSEKQYTRVNKNEQNRTRVNTTEHN